MKSGNPAGQGGAFQGVDATDGTGNTDSAATIDSTATAGGGGRTNTPPPAAQDTGQRRDLWDWIDGKPATPRPTASAGLPASGRDVTPYAAAALTRECADVAATTEGGRNHRLNTAAFNLGSLIEAGALNRGDVERALEQAGRACGLADTEIRATIASGFRGAAEKVGARVIPEATNTSSADYGATDVGDLGVVAGTADDGDDGTPGGAAGWQPFDLGPYLRGEIQQPTPSLGMARTDGLRLIYPGKEHAVIGETESGKSWFALGAAAVEMIAGHTVVYIHYEEADPGSTIERLRRLGLPDTMIAERLRFVAPINPVRGEWLAALLDPAPRLVIHDGVNEAMALHGAGIKDVEGAAEFRRRLVLPCLRAGAATLACDHLPMMREAGRRDAIGSVHKGNAIDGARFLLDNVEPFGRGMRGVSRLYVTKDRPGYLRANGEPSRAAPGKTYMGTLVADDTPAGAGPDFLTLYAPKADTGDDTTFTTGPAGDPVAEAIVAVLAGLNGQQVESKAKLAAHLRAAGHSFRDAAVREALDDLGVAQRVREMRGPRGAQGYQLTETTSARVSDE